MGNVRLLRLARSPHSRASGHLGLAKRLSDTADWIEGNLPDTECFVREDAVAALRWAAGFLCRAKMREDDLGGALLVVGRVLRDSIFPGFAAVVPEILAIRRPPNHPGSYPESEDEAQKMHEKLEQRIERVSAERARRLYTGVIALADRIENVGGLPIEVARALRQLGFALAACTHDAAGQSKQLSLLRVALPVLEEIARYMASHYRDEAAILLRSASELLANAREAQNLNSGLSE